MSKWNFDIDKSLNSSGNKENFESVEITEKIRKIRSNRQKFENPKCITLLETVFDPIEKLYDETIIKEGFDLSNSVSRNISDSGQEMLAGIEGSPDSLQNAFNQIAEVNKSNKSKSGSDELDKLKSGKIKDALAETKNFLLPDPSVSNLSTPKKISSDSTGNNPFQNGKDGIDSIMGRATGSSFFDKLSGDSITLKGKIDALQGDMNNKKLPGQSPGVNLADSMNAPGSSPGISTSSIKVVGLGDQLKSKMKETTDKIGNILKMIMNFLGIELKYAAAKFQSFFVHFRDNFNYLIITIANALTHNNATLDEVKVFSSETLKFTTVLFTYVFLYNWYYLMFHNDDPSFRYTINVQEQVFDRSKFLYGIFGPSLRALELVDWFLLEIIPMIKNYITSKPILFFLLAIIFFILVLANFQMTLLSSFLKALTFSPTQSILSTLISIVVLGYGMKFICYDAGLLGSIFGTNNIFIIIIGGIFFLLLFIFYLLFISSFSAPLGVLLVNTYILLYSFLAILIYERSKTFTVVNDIFTAVSGLNHDEGEEEGGEGEGMATRIVTRMGNFISKYAKFINMFLVELLIIMILLFGINTYTSQYGSIVFDKTSAANKNSIATPVNSAFTHLFTWLIIFNTLLIIFIAVRMVGKYYKLTDPNHQQEEGEGEGEEAG